MKSPMSEDQFTGIALMVVISVWMGVISMLIHWVVTLF